MDVLNTSPNAPQGRSVEAGRGLAWWTEAWALFTPNAGLWIVLGLVTLVIFVVLGFVPLLGGLALSLLTPVFMGSWLLAARKATQGGAPELGDLFLAFKAPYLNPLLVQGAVVLGAAVLISVAAGVLGLGAVFGLVMGGAMHSMGGMMAAAGSGMVALLVLLTLGFLVGMALWFAPALVVFRGVAPVDALKASFAASLKNIVPFLLYSVVYLVASVLASIPFGLGWVVLVPLLLLSLYTSYQDVYGG